MNRLLPWIKANNNVLQGHECPDQGKANMNDVQGQQYHSHCFVELPLVQNQSSNEQRKDANKDTDPIQEIGGHSLKSDVFTKDS